MEILSLDVVVVTRVYAFDKLIELCTLNCYIFMACKLYPNNVFNKARWDGILKRSCSQGVRT